MWGSVPCIHQNGDITGYSVQYRAVGSENKDTVETSETEITLLSLTPETDYEISVAAVNTEGIGVSTNTSAKTSAERATGISSSAVAAPTSGAVIGVLLLILLVAVLLIVFVRWRRSHRGSVKVKSKPLPPPKPLREREEEEKGGSQSGLEMKDFEESNEEEKEYYFEDPSNIVVSRSDVPVAEFPEYVKLLHQDRDRKLEVEYKSLEKLPAASTEAAKLACNISHNRFKNIFPYDHSRVQLKGNPAEKGSDYINASFIDGYPEKKKAYIASQGPTELTANRFWEMVWDYQIPTIVMLTRCFED
ncbi:Tyrosine-protein phosphatase Lar, partial [Geodia barretti]